jgi:hypothetical protein
MHEFPHCADSCRCCAARAQQQAPALTPEMLSLTAELASLGGGDARLGAPVACARVRPPRGGDNAAAVAVAAAAAAAAAGTYAPRSALPAVSVAADGVTVGACAPRRCAAAAPLHAHAHAHTHAHWPCVRAFASACLSSVTHAAPPHARLPPRLPPPQSCARAAARRCLRACSAWPPRFRATRRSGRFSTAASAQHCSPGGATASTPPSLP